MCQFRETHAQFKVLNNNDSHWLLVLYYSLISYYFKHTFPLNKMPLVERNYNLMCRMVSLFVNSQSSSMYVVLHNKSTMHCSFRPITVALLSTQRNMYVKHAIHKRQPVKVYTKRKMKKKIKITTF